MDTRKHPIPATRPQAATNAWAQKLVITAAPGGVRDAIGTLSAEHLAPPEDESALFLAETAFPEVARPLVRPELPSAKPTPVEQQPRSGSPVTPAGKTPPGGWTRSLRLAQVVCWQLALVCAVLAFTSTFWLAVPAAGILAATTVRVRQRWLYQLAASWSRFKLRPRHYELPAGEYTATALLDLLRPGATVSEAGKVMTISHRQGLSAILRPKAHATADIAETLAAPAKLVPTALNTPYEFGVQTVFHSGVRADSPIRTWIAVHTTRSATIPTDDELRIALHNGIRTMSGTLDRAGLPTEALSTDPALAAISALAHVTGGRYDIAEDWGYLHTGPVAQTCFSLDGWDALPPSAAHRLITNLLHATAGVAVTVTASARTKNDELHVAALLRLAATTEVAIEDMAAHITDPLYIAGIRLTRLDGSQTSGVAASLPIGGFLS